MTKRRAKKGVGEKMATVLEGYTGVSAGVGLITWQDIRFPFS